MFEKLNTGDILFTSCSAVEIPCRHVGIVVNTGAKKLIYHNSPDYENVFGGSIIAEDLSKFLTERTVFRTLRTSVTKERILQVSRKHKTRKWNSLFFNCED